MKIDVLQITDAEMEVMKLMWRLNKPLTAAEIKLNLIDKQWTISTIHTLAGRLENRGVIMHYKGNGENYYLSYITESDYKFMVLKNAMRLLCGDSLSDMLQTMLCDMELTGEELAKVKELVVNAVPMSEYFNDAADEYTVSECPVKRKHRTYQIDLPSVSLRRAALFEMKSNWAEKDGMFYDSA